MLNPEPFRGRYLDKVSAWELPSKCTTWENLDGLGEGVWRERTREFSGSWHC